MSLFDVRFDVVPIIKDKASRYDTGLRRIDGIFFWRLAGRVQYCRINPTDGKYEWKLTVNETCHKEIFHE